MSGPRTPRTPPTLRTFVALPLSSEVRQAITALQGELKRLIAAHRLPAGIVRWVDPGIIHLTLHFLGDILPERVEPVKTALTVVARNIPCFEFETGGLGVFPNLNRPQVLWVGVQDPSGWLALLHAAVDEALASLGFQPEQRRFSPHLTLGRVPRNAGHSDVRALGEIITATRETTLSSATLGSVQVADLVFFQSVLKPTGPEYTPLGAFRLIEERHPDL